MSLNYKKWLFDLENPIWSIQMPKEGKLNQLYKLSDAVEVFVYKWTGKANLVSQYWLPGSMRIA